jgi:hypothetical protein
MMKGVPVDHPRSAGFHMRRNYWIVVANAVALVAVVGCRDNIVAPSAAPSGAATTMFQAPDGHPSLSLVGGSSNESTDFTVGPQGGVYFVGSHAVVFPAHSICDPARSSYGPGTWDSPCAVLKAPIKIHAEVRTEGGRSWVDFQPELRFAPSNNPSRWVWMFMRAPEAAGAKGDLSRFNILFAESIGGQTTNDAASDPTLRTYVDTRSGLSFRRIQHFSGYVVAGFAADVGDRLGGLLDGLGR